MLYPLWSFPQLTWFEHCKMTAGCHAQTSEVHKIQLDNPLRGWINFLREGFFFKNLSAPNNYKWHYLRIAFEYLDDKVCCVLATFVVHKRKRVHKCKNSCLGTCARGVLLSLIYLMSACCWKWFGILFWFCVTVFCSAIVCVGCPWLTGWLLIILYRVRRHFHIKNATACGTTNLPVGILF